MGFFNFNRNKSRPESQASTGETSAQWDQLRNQTVSTDAAAQAERIAANKARQERKAIGMALYGESAIDQPDIQITDQDREQVYQLINSGQFGPAQQSAILQKIAVPSRAHGGTPQEVFAKLSDRHSRRIFAFVNGTPDTDENLRDMPSTMVDATLNRYPTPIEFNVKADEMMRILRERNPEAKCQEYERDLETFRQRLYGKRQEYYEAFQTLERQAKQRQDTQASRTRVLQAIRQTDSQPAGQFAYPDEDLGYQAPEARERWRIPDSETPPDDTIDRFARVAEQQLASLPEKVDVYKISSKEAKRFLKEGRIEGDPFMQSGEAYQLTPEYLEKSGLGPEYFFKLGDQADIALSKVYNAQNHDAVTAYVRTKTGTQIVSYYRSNSQGDWRFLPDYVAPSQSSGHSIEWFGKGYDEESLNLPFATQQALEVVNAQPHLENPQLHAMFAFAGTAKHYESKNEYRRAIDGRQLRGRHYLEVDSMPVFNLGKITPNKPQPESLTLQDSAVAPDFTRPSTSYDFMTRLYGPVNSEHYHSPSGRLNWAFNRDQSGRAWIGGVEVESPISSAGLRTQWAQIGNFGTPLYEYKSQAGGYGDPSDEKGSYTSMWKNFLSRTPLIRQYLATKARERR